MLLQQPRSIPSGRTGSIHAVELLLILPIVLALVLGMVEYSLILSIDQQLAVASMQGARVAAQGGSAAEVESAARLALGAGKLNTKAVVTSQLTDVSGDSVAVTVQINDAATVVPNLLLLVGITIKDQALAGSTVLRRE